MTDQDEDQDPGKLGSKPAGHSVEDDDDVEGHFGSIRPTGSKGE